MCGFWKYFFALLIAFISWPAHSTPFAEASIDDLRMWIERDATKYWGPENAVDDGWISIGGSGRHYLIGGDVQGEDFFAGTSDGTDYSVLSDEQFFLPNFYNIRISGRLHMYFDSVGADYAATRIAVGISKDFNLHEYSFTGGELCFYCLGDGSMSFDLSLPLYGQQAVGLDFLRGRVAPFVEVSATVILPVDEPSTITLAIAAIGVFSVCGRTRFVASNR